MPQNHKSVAFSGKKKKTQLKARKERKLLIQTDAGNSRCVYQPVVPLGEEVRVEEGSRGRAGGMGLNFLTGVEAINQQPRARGNTNRYNLKFRKETEQEIANKKAIHYAQIEPQSETALEASSELFYPPGLSYPSRPSWKKNMSKRELDQSENRHFRLFCDNLNREFGVGELSLYELNLETWRQLWRVIEMADILLVIVDARFPVAQFPPYLYSQLVEQEKKGIVMVLNKCDLVPIGVVVAWHHYFHTHYPSLAIVPFSSWESHARRACKLKLATQSSLKLVEACQNLVGDAVDLQSWRRKVEEEGEVSGEGWQECEVGERVNVEAASTRPYHHQKFQDGILTIGTIGHPNVGKSSLINALMGKKVVSVSKTPGHTKHFQTIFLTKSVKLCDCPGLVFPSTITRPLQVLSGSYPISQVRDPISVVQYIAARLDIPAILKLQWDTESYGDEDRETKWTPYFICEAWARKRGYFTRTRGGPDVARASNELLRLCLNAQKSLVLFLRPPGYTAHKENVKCDPLIEEVRLIQGIHAEETDTPARDDEGGEMDVSEEASEEAESEETVASESEVSESEEECSTNTENKFALFNKKY